MQLNETFMPDDAFMFGPQMHDLDPLFTVVHSTTVVHSKESSFDGVCWFRILNFILYDYVGNGYMLDI